MYKLYKNIIFLSCIIIISSSCSYLDYAWAIAQEGKEIEMNYKLFYYQLEFDLK